MSGDVSVVAVSIDGAEAVLETGEIVPIADWFDSDGDDCDPEDAVICVAGPMADGQWCTIDLTQFDATQN